MGWLRITSAGLCRICFGDLTTHFKMGRSIRRFENSVFVDLAHSIVFTERSDDDGRGEQMESNPRLDRKLRVGGIISTLYLLLFGTFETYSAAATALERNPAFPGWERQLGWALFVLPCILIASLFLLRGRRSRIGFSLVIANLCLYAGFMMFEAMNDRGQPTSLQAVWEVGGIWSALFVAALLAA